MSSWQEYKKKKQNNVTSSNSVEVSSWEKYKQQKQNKVKLPTTNMNGQHSVGSGIGHIIKSLGTGVVSGTAGIAQGLLTDTANQLKKGSEKDIKETSKDLTKSLFNLITPGSNINSMKDGVMDNVKNILPIIMNKDKSALEKGTEVVMNAVSGAKNANPVGKFVNSAIQQYGSINKNAGDDVLQVNENISEPIKKMNQSIAEERENYGGVTKFLGSTGQVVGNMAPAIVASAITKNPTISLATMGLSAKGQSTQEALNKGATLDEAVKIGDTKAMIEVGTEMLTGGVNIFGKGAFDDIIEKGIDRKVKNKVANFLIKKGVDIPGEVIEETISDVLSTAIDKGTVDPDANYSFKDWSDTALITTLSTVVLNAIGGGYSKNAYLQNTQKLQQQNQTNQLPQPNNIVENNKETLYNNNESESDIYGEGQRIRSNQGILGQYDTNIQQEQKSQQNKKYTRTEYEQWETNIKATEESNITDEQKQLRNDIKRQYNKDIVFFDGDNSQYNGGASLTNPNNIYINSNEANEFGLKRVALHETLESNIAHNKELKEDIIVPTIESIIHDANFQEQKNSFWEGQEGEIPSDYAIAKDILCDRFAELKSGEQLDYRNVLSQETNMTIDYAIENFENRLKEVIPNEDNSMQNIKNYAQDNQGGSLTKEQQEYFKDSKIRDDDGRLLELYHRTNADFEEFDANKIGSANDEGIWGRGFYFSDKDHTHYGKNLKKVYLNITNPFIVNKFKTIKEMADYLDIVEENFHYEPNGIIRINYNQVRQFTSHVKEKGHDGVIVEHDNGTKEIVAFDSNQIKNVTDNSKQLTRHDVIQKNREIAKENITNIATWKDKKSGLKYQLETMERNMYDIIPNKEEAKRMNATYFEPIHSSEAEKQKFINSYNDRIKEFKLNKYESEAVQVLGEQKYNPSFDATEAKDILDNVKENIKKGKIDEQKVDKAIETFRKIYDELFDLENNVLKQNGYKEKPYRKGYFPHFIDYVAETKTEKILEKIGFKIDKRPLPTDIAGITEQFVPGKTWNRSALQRKTNKTDYNALKGFDTYIAQASDNIFHTENIQRLRGLENEIRYQYSEKGIQERIDNILNDESLYEDEKQDLIDNILEQANNPVPNLVTELRRYTNALANKKSEADRSIENKIGRPIYSTVNAIENRFAANAVGLNIGSALTNFIPITQAYSQISTKNMARAMIDTVKSYANNDGFSKKSTFLTNRVEQAEKLYKTSIEKISDKTTFLFNAIDEVTSNIIVRGKYLENIEKGMSENDAINDADSFARKVIGSRSKGSLPTIFEEKNPVTKIFTQFQLEVNNQYRYMFKDIPRDLAEKGLGAIALAFFKMFVGAWLYNIVSEKIMGRKAAFSPIDLVASAYENITDDNKKTYDKVADIATDIGEQVPFLGGLIGGGRVPVSGAIPNISNLTKASIGLATGEMDSKKATDTLKKEISKPLYYLLPPFGGGQLKKSIEGISTVANGGSYGIDSKGEETLQFPVENASVKDYVQAGVFGKYSLPIAREYQNRNFKSLTAKQTETYKQTNIPYKEYLQYIDAKLSTKQEKLDYLNKQEWSDNQKWGIFTRDILSSNPRKDGSSQLSDAQYMLRTGISKKKYMQLYSKANQYDISLPTEEDYKKIRKEGTTLEEYINKKIAEKKKKANK